MERLHISAQERPWFIASAAFGGAALLYVLVFASGVLQTPMLMIERWLVRRPLVPADCVLRQWEQFGQFSSSLVVTCILGAICLLLGYRKRIFLLLILLLSLSAGVELVGKHIFAQPVPTQLDNGIVALQCVQLDGQSNTLKMQMALGMWWQAPALTPDIPNMQQMGISSPLNTDGDDPVNHSFPSGHTIRWLFVGLLVAWLAGRHMKKGILRRILISVALLIAIGGGLVQFYLGFHLITDVLAGYLLGGASICCAIGLLLRNERGRRHAGHQQGIVERSSVEVVSK